LDEGNEGLGEPSIMGGFNWNKQRIRKDRSTPMGHSKGNNCPSIRNRASKKRNMTNFVRYIIGRLDNSIHYTQLTYIRGGRPTYPKASWKDEK
jgi:hypothetical protein